jgi:hypothetical protein
MMDSDQKLTLLRSKFPGLPEEDLEEIKTFLDEYCELLLRIFHRLEQESGNDFDQRAYGP